MPRLAPLLALIVLAACGPDKALEQKCFTLRIGMPVEVLVREMGQPAEKLPGDRLTSYIYGRRSMDERSTHTIAVDMETNKVATVVCGDKAVWQYYTPADAAQAKEQADGETKEGRERQSRNDAALHEIKLAEQRFRRKSGASPRTMEELAWSFPNNSIPTLDLPEHGASTPSEDFEPEDCSISGDAPTIDPKKIRDTGHWGYIGQGPCAGYVFIDCNHWAARGRRWYQFR